MSTLIKKLMVTHPQGLNKASFMHWVNKLMGAVALPILGVLGFMLVWSAGADRIDTSLGKFPGPAAVATQVVNLYEEHKAERVKEVAFYQRQEERNAKRVAKDPTYQPKIRSYTGKETFIDQIATSLKTVLSGFLLAALVAIPFGIAIGLSKSLNLAINPIAVSYTHLTLPTRS